tara:strand:+ start:1289 stop:1660 length:372 start_codon:yes stop_codon:yes gene_type:complete
MKLREFFANGLLAGLLMVPMLTQAHTALKESNPKNGVTVSEIPEKIDLVFSAKVRLIKLELMGVGHEMPTSFKPTSEAIATYQFDTPGMHPGEFTVNWAALGEDGHTLTNSFTFVVDPDGAAD